MSRLRQRVRETTMTAFPVRAQQTFAPEASSVAGARRFTRETLGGWDVGELVDSAALIVSELVTNAVVHTGTPIQVTLARHGRGLRVDVEDQHPGRELPLDMSPPVDTSEGGRGLLITTSLATAWGVEYTRTSKRVWAVCEPVDAPEVPGPGARTGEARRPGRTAKVAVVGISDQGTVTGWNDDAVALFGWSEAEVSGRRYTDLADLGASGPPGDDEPTGTGSWQGTYELACRDGRTRPVFASHTRVADSGGTIALLVAEDERALLEHPVVTPRVVQAGSEPLGMRDDALVRLGVEEYLTLAAERVRDPVAADATYVLLAHDFDDQLEVAAVSGLAEQLLGTRLMPGAPGAPHQHSTTLPVVVPDRADHEVPLLADTGLRSLVVVPMVVESKVVGAVAAASAVAHGFNEEQAARLQRFADSIALTADRARLRASERERRGWLNYIADSGDLLAGSLDQEMTMAITGQIVVPRIARWCAIHLADERDELRLEQVWHEDEGRLDALRAALEEIPGAALVGDDARVPGYSATSIQLVARGKRIGFLTIGREPGELRGSEFYLVAESIARRAALAIDNARAHGALQAAGRALQESLLPASVPSAPGYDVGVVYDAAGEDAAAGGDFYDLFPTDAGTWCFVVGDVCGTGAEAAAVTGLARHTIQALARTGLPIAATLERLNTAILEEGTRARFLTLVCGSLRLEDGRVRLDLVNAGHPPPYLVGRDGAVRELGTPQTLLGVVERVAYVAERHVLERGDLLVTVTDGVLERRDGGRMLGEEGFADLLAGAGHLPAQDVADAIQRLVSDFSASPHSDDVAIMAIRVLTGVAPDPGPRAAEAQPAEEAQRAEVVPT